jgi:hypothetical protein
VSTSFSCFPFPSVCAWHLSSFLRTCVSVSHATLLFFNLAATHFFPSFFSVFHHLFFALAAAHFRRSCDIAPDISNELLDRIQVSMNTVLIRHNSVFCLRVFVLKRKEV